MTLSESVVVVGIAVAAVAGLAAQQVVPAGPPSGAPPRSAELPNTGTAALSGVVTDATTGQPIAGAVVSLSSVARGSFLRTPRMTTDSKGRFVFVSLPGGDDYVVTATTFGYASGGYGRTSPDDTTVRIRLADAQWMGEANVRLWKLGAIGGRVTDERGEPMVGVAVRLFGMRNISGRARLVGGPVTLTDDRGVYRIANLQPGEYVVGALSSQSTILDSTPEGPAYRPLGGLDGGGYASRREPVGGPTIDDRDGRHRHVMSVLNE